ncbi:MAG: hypothetical protein AAGA54_28930 [Myxococcota bacterium]
MHRCALFFSVFAALGLGCDTETPSEDETSSTTTDASTTAPASTSSTSTTAPGSTSSTAESSEASTAADDSTGSTGGETSTGGSTGSTGGSTGSTGGSTSTGEVTEPEACFEGGADTTPTGAGTCASPYVIDLSAGPHGTILAHTLSGGGDEMDMGGGGDCDAEPVGTARDVVYQVLMPADVTALLLSVDPVEGANPRLAVAEDPSCFQPMNACADEGTASQCEGLVAERGGFGFVGNSTYVVVSEVANSGADLTVRFQTTDVR